MAQNKQTRSQSQSIKSMMQESPRSTVKVAPIDKDKDKDKEEKISDSEFGKFKEEMRAMFTEISNNISERIHAFDEKFTGMFRSFQNEMETLRQEVNQTKEGISKVTEKVNEIEQSLEFHSQSLKDNDKKQEDNLKATKEFIDQKLQEMNNKLLLLEKQDRKYNLLIYGVPEESDENVCEKMRDLFINELQISGTRVDNMYFAHGHRLPSKSNRGPRPIIIRFTSYGDRGLVLSNAPKLAGTKRRIVSDLPVVMKEARGELAKEAFKIRHEENLQTRIKEQGLKVYLEVRKNSTDSWVRRM